MCHKHYASNIEYVLFYTIVHSVFLRGPMNTIINAID